MFYSRIKTFWHQFPTIFQISCFLALFLFFIGLLNPEGLAQKIEYINKGIFRIFGMYYLWFVSFSLLAFILIGISPLGNIKIGGTSTKPEYSFLSWFSMLFCAGMGVGLLFWGPAEPLYHFMHPPVINSITNSQKEINALLLSFFHWGLHPWGIYGLTALAVSFFSMNQKKSLYFSSFLFETSKNQTLLQRFCRIFIDLTTILAILFGVVASFGMGIIQFEGGLKNVFNINHSFLLQILIIVFFTVSYMLSALKGLKKGIKVLSNFSILLSFGLLLSVIWFIPKGNIIQLFFHTMPVYILKLPALSFGYFNFKEIDFLREWTVKYWSWWIAWAPFVGIFIALISKGRTIRELVIASLVAPSLFSFLWFFAFGKAAIFLQISQHFAGSTLAFEDTNLILFRMLDGVTSIALFSWISIILIAIFFINSADSATYTLATLSEQDCNSNNNSENNPPRRILQFGWGLLFSTLTILFLFIGEIKILQEITLITVLPFSMLLTFIFIKLVKQMIIYSKLVN